MSSLQFHRQHLAWQQRISKEIGTKSNFYVQNPFRSFPAKLYTAQSLVQRRSQLLPIFPQYTPENMLRTYTGPMYRQMPYAESRGKYAGRPVQDYQALPSRPVSTRSKSVRNSRPQTQRSSVRSSRPSSRETRQQNVVSEEKSVSKASFQTKSSAQLIEELEEQLNRERKQRLQLESQVEELRNSKHAVQ